MLLAKLFPDKQYDKKPRHDTDSRSTLRAGARLSACPIGLASDQCPEDVLTGNEAEGLVERQDGATERASGRPAFLPERPVEHLDATVVCVGAQASDRRPRLGMVE